MHSQPPTQNYASFIYNFSLFHIYIWANSGCGGGGVGRRRRRRRSAQGSPAAPAAAAGAARASMQQRLELIPGSACAFLPIIGVWTWWHRRGALPAAALDQKTITRDRSEICADTYQQPHLACKFAALCFYFICIELVFVYFCCAEGACRIRTLGGKHDMLLWYGRPILANWPVWWSVKCYIYTMQLFLFMGGAWLSEKGWLFTVLFLGAAKVGKKCNLPL